MSAANETMPTSTASPPAKYSRYRSVRRNVNAEPEPPNPVEVKPKEEGIARSMSRYRRSRAVPKTDFSIGSPPIPEVPQLPRQVHSQSVNSSSTSNILRDESERRVTAPNTPSHSQQGGAVKQRRPREIDEERAKQKARQLQLLEEEERREAEQELALEAQKAEEEASRRLEEQKKKDLQRLEAELEAAAPIQRVSSPREKLKFFSRKKGTKPTTPISPGVAIEHTGFTTLARPQIKSDLPSRVIGAPQPVEQARSAEQRHGQPRKPEAPRIEVTNAIGQGGGGIVPQTDAPISASNAGERRVLIRCKQSSINLPITPETTPVELIYSAANIMTQNISISTAIIIESFTQLGLERRVRRYEHVRDILNSWDRDTQNALTIENSDSPKFDQDLEVSNAIKYTPADFTVHMYHSQKPGKWNKRYITLLAMGQIFISKKAGAKVTDKDVINICHLSDFDIYTPTAQQLRKVLKPPKKHCYAIKSQQKTTMFLSTENFVHFFCTDDVKLADKWYETVQQWRSWYLVTRMGEGKASTTGKTIKKTSSSLLDRGGSKAGHTTKISVDENPYTIGSFQPLINLDRFGSPSHDQSNDSDDENTPRQIPFHLRNGVPPPKRDSKRYPPTVNYKLPAEAEDEFASDGLLGRTYSQRQQKDRDSANDGPFTNGPSLLNGPPSSQLHRRSLSVKSTKRPETSGSGLQRTGSQRQKPKPLLDFTPTFREAPQWDKSNKGHGVKGVDGVPLVEVATGPEDRGIPGLPGMVFRRETGGSVGMMRPKTTASSGKDREGAFVKGGLVGDL